MQHLRVFAALLALAVLLAACQGEVASQATPQASTQAVISPPPAAYPAAQAVTGVPGPRPTAVSVAATAAPAAAGGRIVIGVQSPASGPHAALGAGIRNGATMALLQLARPLTDLGYSLELQPLDDQNDSQVAITNAQDLVADPDTRCVVGHLDSAATRAALEIYGEAELALVVPASAGVGLTGSSYDNSLRLVGRDDVQAAIAARFARESLKARRAFLVQGPGEYGEVLAVAFKNRAISSGLQLVGEALSDDAGLSAAIRAARADVVYVAAGYAQAGPLIRALRTADVDIPIIGPDGLDTPELPRLVGAELGELYYTRLTPSLDDLPYADQFLIDYEARHAASAPPFAAQAYDAVAICVEAISRAADEAGARPSRAQVRQALRHLSGYEGVAGSYRFNRRGDLVEAPYLVLRAGAEWAANPVVVTVNAAPPRE
jgi:branched-chain amino acid transport system substrate-binding protein